MTMTEPLACAHRVPLHCFWEITDVCNLRCIHCELDAGTKANGELSTKQALALCDDLATAGCEHVVLTGGEPLMRRDWPLIAKRISALGMRPTIITNGMLVDDAAVEAFRQSGIRAVSVSIDGLEATHNTVRVGPNRADVGSYRKAISALGRLVRAGIKTAAITQVHKGNLHELPALHDALVHLDVDVWQVQICMPLGRLLRLQRPYLIEPTDLPLLTDTLADLIRRNELEIAVGDNIGYYGTQEPVLRGSSRKHRGYWTGCKAGMLAAAICSDGDVKGCPSHPKSFVVGNVLQTPFSHIWEDKTRFEYNTAFREDLLEGKCRTCEYRRICRAGCTTMAFSVTGTIYNNPFCIKQRQSPSREPSR